MFSKQSTDKILFWVRNNKLDEFGRYLVSGTIHGKPGVSVAELDRIEKFIQKSLTDQEQYQLGKKLLKRPEYTARNIGTHLIVAGWPANKDVETHMKKAANDEDWIVREYAAGAFASLLEKDFSHFSKVFLRWIKTESTFVKRAIALAVKYDSKTSDPKKWKTYLGLIHPLMSEEADYIRRNLGPFAIGDGLLSRYPDKVIHSCQKWVHSKNENVRWNTAMIFTAAAARKFPKEGRTLLKTLETDLNPFVSKAAKKALKNLRPSL